MYAKRIVQIGLISAATAMVIGSGSAAIAHEDCDGLGGRCGSGKGKDPGVVVINKIDNQSTAVSESESKSSNLVETVLNTILPPVEGPPASTTTTTTS